MEDIIIKKNTLKREVTIWIISLVIAFGLNAYAIIRYNAPWKELVTQIPVIILISVLIYLLIFIMRGIVTTLRRILLL
jgi:hypothetical protein